MFTKFHVVPVLAYVYKKCSGLRLTFFDDLGDLGHKLHLSYTDVLN